MSTSETPHEGDEQTAPPTPGAPWGGDTAQPPATRPRKVPLWVYWVVGAVVLALVAGLVVFFLVRDRSSGGASSPARAADSVAQQLEDKDVMGLVEQMAPSEYAPYAGHTAALLKDSGLDEAITGDAEKDPISAFESAGDLLDAVDVKKSEMSTKVTHEGEHLAAVDVTSWDVDLSVDRDAMEKALKKVQQRQGSDSISSMLKSLEEADDEDLTKRGDLIEDDTRMRMVMVKEDSGWYVSPVLSMFETSRLNEASNDAGSMPEPDWDADPTASEGAKSPEKAFSGLVDELLDAEGLKDLYADPVLKHLALPERRAVMLYRPYLDQGAESAGESAELGSLFQIGSMINIDWSLKSHRISDSLAVVSMGSTGLSIPMAGELRFDGPKISLSGQGLGADEGIDLGVGLDNPDRLGFAAVKDDGGWRVSFMDTGLNYTTLKATDEALGWGEQMYTEQARAEEDAPEWDELPPLAQNAVGIVASFEKAVDAAEPDDTEEDLIP
jgi:hypothetical protein